MCCHGDLWLRLSSVYVCVSCTLPWRDTAHNDSRPLGSSLISQPPQLMSLKGSGRVVFCEGICPHTWGEMLVNKLPYAQTDTHTQSDTHTYLCPGVHCFVPPVTKPSPATDTGVPLLIFSVGGGEVNGVGPSLLTQTPQSLAHGRNKNR